MVAVRGVVALRHLAFDVLQDDDGVVDDDADRQHQTEQRDIVQAVAHHRHDREGADQRDGHVDHRQDHRPPVLQKEEHDQGDEQDGVVGSSISASTMVYVEGIDSPAEMWRILSERFNPITKTTLLQVIKEFITVSMDETVDTMEIHLQRVQRLKRRVEEQGETISENIYNSILLNSVPKAYHIAVNILESQEQLTPTIIINRLLEESRKMGGTTSESSGKMKMALLSNTTKSGKSGKSSWEDRWI